jgi:hypothetical protein
MTEIPPHNTPHLDLGLKELIPSSLCRPIFKTAKGNNRSLLQRYNETRKYNVCECMRQRTLVCAGILKSFLTINYAVLNLPFWFMGLTAMATAEPTIFFGQ